MYNKEIETLPLNKLRKLQRERLTDLSERVYSKVLFYKKQLEEAGIKPPDIKGVEDLHKIPFTKKTDLRDNYPFDLFAVPMNEVLRIPRSAGGEIEPN